MDLSILLPNREVAEGDVWSVPSEELKELLMLDKLSESMGDNEMSQMVASELLPQFVTILENFKTSCEYKGEREENGRAVGVIAVDLAGEGQVDLEALILAAIEAQNAGIEIDLSIDEAALSLSFAGKGELLWDLKAGVMLSFDLSADIEIEANLAVNADVQGESHELTADLELLGRGAWKARTVTE